MNKHLNCLAEGLMVTRHLMLSYCQCEGSRLWVGLLEQGCGPDAVLMLTVRCWGWSEVTSTLGIQER